MLTICPLYPFPYNQGFVHVGTDTPVFVEITHLGCKSIGDGVWIVANISGEVYTIKSITQNESRFRLWWAITIILAQPIFIWYIWYRFAGYMQWTVNAAQLMIALTGLGLIIAAKLNWQKIGFGAKNLLAAVIIGFVAYAATILIGILLGYTESGEVFRRYTVGGFINGWIMTGIGEELLFAGALFNIVILSKEKMRGALWKTIIIVSLLFALWHLPGYIAVAHNIGTLNLGSILGRLALNAVSWLIFGTIYALSNNFWLVVVAHASTDYPFTGLITEVPTMGLLFMSLLILGGWYSGRHHSMSK